MKKKKPSKNSVELETERKKLLNDLGGKNRWRLVNAEEMHLILHCGLSFVLAAKRSGAPFPGGKTTPDEFHKWLFAHPNFTVKQSRKKKNDNGDKKKD